MALLRDSAIVGAATFLVGSVLMDISIKQEGEPVGWWPYVGTFLSGALGFYLLAATDVVKVKNAESNCSDCGSIAEDDGLNSQGNQTWICSNSECQNWWSDAESFGAEGDRKLRRRTNLTWSRGMDPAFKDDFIPYSVPHYGDYYEDINAYHVKNLEPGYHIHLWKPATRRMSALWTRTTRTFWRAYMKSPHSKEWVMHPAGAKKNLKGRVLKWYNNAIAAPVVIELTPIQKMMGQQGMIWIEPEVHRVVPMPGTIQYYYSGGSAEHELTLIGAVEGGEFEVESWEKELPISIENFCRGLIYIRGDAIGSLRSVNRYNNDREKWLSSYPAWFQNMCKQGISNLHFKRDWKKDFGRVYSINLKEFLHFGDDNGLQQFNVKLPVKDKDTGEIKYEWTKIRPSTQKKMYEKNPNNMDKHFTPTTDVRQLFILYHCVAKYHPEQWPEIQESMTRTSVLYNGEGWGLKDSAQVGQLMCRRFKKKLN